MSTLKGENWEKFWAKTNLMHGLFLVTSNSSNFQFELFKGHSNCSVGRLQGQNILNIIISYSKITFTRVGWGKCSQFLKMFNCSGHNQHNTLWQHWKRCTDAHNSVITHKLFRATLWLVTGALLLLAETCQMWRWTVQNSVKI